MLDWELSTLGDPVADFVYHLLMYRMPAGMFTGLAGPRLRRARNPRRSRIMSPLIAARTGRDAVCPTSTI